MFSDLLDIPGELRVNWYEVAISNSRGLRRSINVPFKPDHIFIFNPTDANLYMAIGGDRVPDVSNADLTCLSQSYYRFTPTDTDTWQFGALLDSPVSDYPCNIIFAAGESQQDRERLEAIWNEINIWVTAGMMRGFLFYALFCHLSDFALSDDGWTALASCTYTPGTGFVGSPGSPQIDVDLLQQARLDAVTIDYDVVGAGFVTWTIYIRVFNGGVLQNPPLGTVVGAVLGGDPAGSYSKSLDLTALPSNIRTGDNWNVLFLTGGGVGKTIDITGVQVDYLAESAYAASNCP